MKLLGMKDGWSPHEIADAICDVFSICGPAQWRVVSKWIDQGKVQAERRDQIYDLCTRAVRAAYSVDVGATAKDPSQLEELFKQLPYPKALWGLRADLWPRKIAKA